MANYKKNWLAVVIAYRKEETDLAATVESAKLSAGLGAQIITVEDKDATGPGWNRHRGNRQYLRPTERFALLRRE